ncbi:MAG: DUF3750 domain-containing protein, partial [Burkholderiales bacterium]
GMRNGIQILSLGFVTAAMARAIAFGSGALRDRRKGGVEPHRLAPDPALTSQPVIQVYGARCLHWRRYFSIHTWIALKPAGARGYTVYEVTSSSLRRRGSAVVVRKRRPDAPWFGNPPELLAEKRGDGSLIERIENAIREYRYAQKYVAWPGPNSNTFIAHLARAVPELGLSLPSTAIGKDYIGGRLIWTAPSGCGVQLSLFGLVGVLASPIEGLEVNVLGLTFGVDPFVPAIKLPLIGRLGLSRSNGPGAQANLPAHTSKAAG